MHPTVISHGYNSHRDRPRWMEEFDWVGTDDPSAWLSLPFTLEYVGNLLPGGWDAVRAHNHQLVMQGRDLLCRAWGTPPTVTEDMVGSMAAVVLPNAPSASAWGVEHVQSRLWEEHHIQVPLHVWPHGAQCLLRISAHLHNTLDDYRRLAGAMGQLLNLGGAQA